MSYLQPNSKKEYNLCQKYGYKMQSLTDIMFALENEVPLQPKNRERRLQCNYKDFLECYIKPDWLLPYKINLKTEEIYSNRTGIHADLVK